MRPLLASSDVSARTLLGTAAARSIACCSSVEIVPSAMVRSRLSHDGLFERACRSRDIDAWADGIARQLQATDEAEGRSEHTQ